MIGHGLCSPAIFILVNIIYDRSKSRNIYINKGILIFYPRITILWFIICSRNIAAPISLNLFRELIIVYSILLWFKEIFLFLGIRIYIRATYTLYLFSLRQHGKIFTNIKNLFNNNEIEYLIILLYWIPLNIIIIKLNLFI